MKPRIEKVAETQSHWASRFGSILYPYPNSAARSMAVRTETNSFIPSVYLRRIIDC